MISIQILTRDNEKTIERTLKSVSSIDANVFVGDLGSKDRTLEICSDYGANLVPVDWRKDYSSARNILVKEGMNMMIEPWEFVAKGHEEINCCDKNANVLIVQGMSASKELRLWRSLEFKNPVYEFLDDNDANLLDGVAFVSSGRPDRRKEEVSLCDSWRKLRPTDLDPWYYSAFSSLALGMVDEFLSYAERYMAMTRKFGSAEIQISYRMAQAVAAKGLYGKAAGIAIRCLALRPCFAEFWCLFGDIFMKNKDYFKARSMYKNALEIGARRSASDLEPVEISKYKAYPEEMIRIIDGMDERTGVIVRQKS